MTNIFSTTLFTRIFGDTTTELLVNTAVVSLIIYVLYKHFIKPVWSITTDIIELFKNRDMACIHITPPHKNEIDPDHTKNLMYALQSIYAKERLSLEINSTKNTGITYQIVVEERAVKGIKKQLMAYLPEMKIRVTALEKQDVAHRIYSFKLKRHFAYPLKTYVTYERTDPMSYIASALTRMDDDESVILQFVVRPYSPKSARKIYNRILKDGRSNIGGGLKAFAITYAWVWVPGVLVWLISKNWALGLITSFLVWIVALFSQNELPRALTSTEEKLYDEIIEKLDQPLARVDMRLSVLSEKRQHIVDDFMSSLKVFERTGFQAIVPSRSINHSVWQKYVSKLFVNRLSSIFTRNYMVLGTPELSSLYHFPYGVIKTEGMVRSHSRTLPAPLSLKGNTKLDVVLGVNKHQGEETPIGLTESERERHMYIIGGTGSGKTTMLKYQIVQDMRNGKGVAVVDPHGDLAEELLDFVPKERRKDLIYLNPDDLDHPLGVNLLELPEGLSGNDLLREKDRVTESVVSVMRKIFSDDDSGGHRIEYVLRNTIQTALTMDEANLFTIFRLLNDAKFRKSVVNNLENEDLKIFWKNEIGKAGEMQKVKMAAGITAKIGRFLFSASAKKILEQNKSTIDFDRLMDEQKILICNFSKGLLGEDTSMLFGVTILAKMQLASLRRARQTQSDRKPFYLYVDEFQNFATMSFVQMLSESRKYKLFLIMAEQSTQQQDEQRLVDIVLANVGTVITFRTGSPADERILLPLFRPFIEENELSNIPSYNFYARISAVNTQEPVSGTTCLLEINPDLSIARSIKEYSRNKYGFTPEESQVQVAPKVLINTRQARKKKLKKSPNLEQVIT